MSQVYFIINYCDNHTSIINKGSGASELLFYMTAYELSKHIPVIVFNRDTPQKIDSLEYKFLPDNINPNIENINNSVIVVQRHMDHLINLHKINPSNKYILWSHDYLHESFPNLSGSYSPKEVNEYFNKHNITIVSLSEFHKKNLLLRFPDVNIVPIHYTLFSEIYKKNQEIEYDKNKIIFASSWGKGLDKVLRIGREYYSKNNQFKLVLIKPCYCDGWNVNSNGDYPFIEQIGSIENKDEYCELLQRCLAVFTTSYPETFGNVFAEALHLGVPVIGDSNTDAGFHEFIPKEYMCNFNNPNEVIEKIEKMRENRPNVSLNSNFYRDFIIPKWLNLLR